MSLRAQFSAAAVNTFNAFDDVPEICTLKKMTGTPSYNTTTGVVTKPTTDYASRCVMVDFEQKEIDGDLVRIGDMLAIIIQAELAASPTVNDQLVADSRTWEVRNIGKDPADALWLLHVRTVHQ